MIVYFSYEGHTRQLAKQIQELTGDDIFEPQPADPYPKDYNTVVDQGKEEVDSNYRPKLRESVPNLDKASIIYVGTPIWWFTVSPVVAAFLEDSRLAGKTIVPFCTHGGYGAGQSYNDMKRIATKSNFLDELVCKGSKSYNQKAIKDWLAKVK